MRRATRSALRRFAAALLRHLETHRAYATDWRVASPRPRGDNNQSRCADSMKRTNMRNIRARLVIWIATRIVIMIDRSLQLPQELDEI
jgi:hypothetical protein